MLTDNKNNSKKINLILLKKIGLPILGKTYTSQVLKRFLRNELVN